MLCPQATGVRGGIQVNIYCLSFCLFLCFFFLLCRTNEGLIINIVSGGFLNTSTKLRGILRRFPTGFLKTDFPKKLDFFSLDNW